MLHTGFCMQVSVSVHVLLLFGVLTHPLEGSHVSSVHGFLSSQLIGVGAPHAPVVVLQVAA